MQCVEKFKEFHDLLTEAYNKYAHKKKPQDLEKALREVIEKGEEMLQKLQQQDRFV